MINSQCQNGGLRLLQGHSPSGEPQCIDVVGMEASSGDVLVKCTPPSCHWASPAKTPLIAGPAIKADIDVSLSLLCVGDTPRCQSTVQKTTIHLSKPAFKSAFADSSALLNILISVKHGVMQTKLEEGEAIIRKSLANHQRGVEAVGGKLYLTQQRLIFEAHAFNFQTGATVVTLPSITALRKDWTLLFGTIPVFPNCLVVSSQAGEDNRFTLYRRTPWIKDIQKLKGMK